MEELINYFDGNKEVAKAFFRIDRQEFLLQLSEMKASIPLNLKNLVFLANIYQIKDEYILGITPKTLIKFIEE